MISGIISEYNIFHNGHKYQIDEVKKQSDAVVAVMSGSFVQRGDVAVTDKWSRAKAALISGVDLVIELPVCYALNAAPCFATGGINTLNALGIIDTVVFGSECGNVNSLTHAARLMENESGDVSDMVKAYMADGMSYPSALSKAYHGRIDVKLLSEPNNILAVEYIRTLIRLNSSIHPVTIQRILANHHSKSIAGSIASASKIREMLFSGEDVSELIPYSLSEIGGDIPYSVSNLDSAIIAKLRTSDTSELENISEVTEGLENRILQSSMECGSFSLLAEKVKSKRYTMSKIRRIMLAALLDFTKDIYKPMPEYIRVLGMNKTGMEILKKAKKNCCVPIITKAANFKEKSTQFKLDTRATDIAMLCNPKKERRIGGMDFKKSPVILDN